MRGDEEGIKRDARLGTCPECDGPIPDRRLLVRYEPKDGWPRIFAECPACLDVVQPR